MSIIIPANTLAAGGFSVDNSVRMDGASKLTRSFGSAGNRKKWTMSMWVKRSKIGADQKLMGKYTSSSDRFALLFNGSDQLQIFWGNDGGNKQITTNRLFRDTSAFYNFTFIIDTGNSTEADRMQIWVNGVRETSMASTAYPTSGQDLPWNDSGVNEIGSYNNSNKFSGYLAEVVHQNDNAATPVDKFISFDEDTGICVPIDVSGLTLGTNGFYLDFEDSSALGNDASGSNNFTSAGLAAIDQTTDTCTNNFATLNPLDNFYTPHSLSEGNLKQTTDSSSGYAPNLSTIALTQGKWYFEVKYVSRSSSDNYNLIGIKSTQITDTKFLGQNAHDYGYYSENGKYYTNNGATSYGASYDQGNIIGCYLDLDNNKLYFAKNGAIQNSGTGISITAPASTPLGHYFFAVGDYGGSLTIVNECNFGNPLYTGTDKSDANGYGSFEYDPSVGTFNGVSKDFYALNTKNLAEFG